MTKKAKKTEIKIQNFLRKHKGTYYKQKKIAKALNIPNSEYPSFKGLLKEMAKAGKIFCGRNSTYGIPDKSQEVSGIISFTTRGFAFVKTNDEEEIFVNASDTNVALHKDLVQVAIKRKSQGKKREGKVVKVLKRANEPVYGILKKDGKSWEVIPESPFPPTNIILLEEKPEYEEDKLVEVHNIKWYSPRNYPVAEFKQTIGSPDNPADDFLIIQRMFDLAEEFPEDILKQADQLKIPKISEMSKTRLDLRDKDIFTIDPKTAKDFDDAISLEILDNDLMELGVHIADVSHFVKEGSELDKIALDRSMSCYLGDNVIPMLPEKISNELCSLKPNEPRLAFSVLMKITTSGEVKDYDIRESLIESKKRFTYEEAQQILDTKKGPYYKELQRMNQLHKTLLKNRKAKGSIDFDLPEPIFKFDDKGLPIEISRSERRDTNRLIEDFMLLANKVIATHIAVTNKSKNLPFVYRIHETPTDEKINQLYAVLKQLGIKAEKPTKKFTPQDMQKILDKIKDTPFANFIEQISLRSMTKAQYSTQPLSHFGLAFSHYTHFTSPIRRYPDLIVHRLLKKYAGGAKAQDIDYYSKKLPKICDFCTELEIKYLEAEREFIKIKQIRFLADKIGEEYTGIITGVLDFGFFVEISEFLVEGLVHVRTLNDDFYVYSEDQHTLKGRDHGKTYRLGDTVKIKIKEVSIKTRRIDFLLID